MEGIRRDDEATDKIGQRSRRTYTSRTPIARVDTRKGEHYYDLLQPCFQRVLPCMMSAETCDDDLEALAQKISPILTKHANDITLNKKLFERIKFVHDHPNRELTARGSRCCSIPATTVSYASGALLDEEGKEKLRKLTEEASMLTLQFSPEPLEGEQGLHPAHHRQGSARRTPRDRHRRCRTERQGERARDGCSHSTILATPRS